MTMTPLYCSARPGLGKTIFVCKRMATRRGKYVYAVDRIDVFAERERLIKEFAVNGGKTSPLIVIYNSKNSFTVRQDVANAPNMYKDERHIIVIITHEALKISMLDHYNGWQLYIDEVPSAWIFQEKKNSLIKDSLKRLFNLSSEPGQKYSRITVKDEVSPSDIANDDDAYGIMTVYKQAKNGNAYANIHTWDDADNWLWFSIWCFDEMRSFSNIVFVANAFEHSLMYKLMVKSGIKFREFHLKDNYTPRNVTISYFDQFNRARSTYFRSKRGIVALEKISKYFEQHDVDFWSCNLDKTDFKYTNYLKLPGRHLAPMVAGSNEYMNFTKCAMIFSAKPSNQEISCLKEIGISPEEIIRSRETETIIQFGTRLSIRVADDARDGMIYVYDKTQAEQLKDFFDNSTMKLNTTLNFVDVGIEPRKPKISEEEKRSKLLSKHRRYNAKRRGKPLVDAAESIT